MAAMMTIQEAADRLGVKRETVYTYIHKKIIPYYVVRDGRRISEEDLEKFQEWKEKGRRVPAVWEEKK